MEQKTLDALHFIIGVLDKHAIPYRIGGGFAASIYGSTRPINDIDITFPGKYFPIVIPEITNHITYDFGPSKDEKWDCIGLTLEYNGQEIDMTDIDTLKMSNKEGIEWFQTKDTFRKYPTVMTKIDGIEVSLIDPRDLAAYKKHLNGEHQVQDVEAVEAYIQNNNL